MMAKERIFCIDAKEREELIEDEENMVFKINTDPGMHTNTAALIEIAYRHQMSS